MSPSHGVRAGGAGVDGVVQRAQFHSLACKSVALSTSWRTEQGKRSRRHTTGTSSSITLCSSGLLRCAPKAVSVNTRLQWGALTASSWNAGLCSAVEMRG